MGFFSKRAKTDDEKKCSFCALERGRVKMLIEGPSVWICDACIGQCNDVCAESDRAEHLGAIDAARFDVLRELARLAPPIDRVVAKTLLEAALVLADDAAACREVALAALGIGDDARALAAYEKVPAADLRAWDRINIACLEDTRGDPGQALRELAAIDVASMPDDAQALLPLYVTSMRVSAGAVTADEAPDLVLATARIVADLPRLGLKDAFRSAIERQARIIQAGLARVVGDTDAALALLRGIVDERADDGHVWALLHDLHEQRGEAELAAKARARALESAPAGGALERRLRLPIHPFR